MAERTQPLLRPQGQAGRFVINLNNMPRLPSNMNITTAVGRQNIGHVVQGLLPALNRVVGSSVNDVAPSIIPHSASRVAGQEPNPEGPSIIGPQLIHMPQDLPTHGHDHPHATNLAGQHENQDPQPFVLDMGSNLQTGSNVELSPDENQNTGTQENGGHGHTHSHSNGNGQGRQTVSLGQLPLKLFEQTLPFLLLIFAKIMYNHRLGILVFLGLCGTFHYANSSLKRQIARRERQSWTDSAGTLLWIMCFMIGNIAFLYYVFDDQQLWRSLLFQLPVTPKLDLLSMLWIVMMNDFIIKFATVVLKALIALQPRFILPYKKRGKYYMLLEHLSQFYRSVVPLVPWFQFLQDDEYGGPWFAWVLIVVYFLCKTQMLWYKARELRTVFKKFKIDVSYGNCPSREDLKEADCCPICQDSFTDPVKLTCTHIFCEDCVSMWFDRERTCPMCRANIVDNPVWRDGSTANNLQFY